MKCIIGILVLTVGAFQMISATPIRSGGMVFYQPDYYNAHRAFVMQYASQPVRSYRRQGEAAGVSAYASGKKISTGTFLRRTCNPNIEEDNEEPHGGAHSVAEAYPGSQDHHHNSEEIPEPSHDEEQSPHEDDNQIPPEVAHDDPNDEIPETPVVALVPSKHHNNKKTPPLSDEEDEHDDEDEENVSVAKRTKNRSSAGTTYFPVSFGSTNGGAIAIANSYSTGKGGTASSRATAYGSPAKTKSKRRNE